MTEEEYRRVKTAALLEIAHLAVILTTPGEGFSESTREALLEELGNELFNARKAAAIGEAEEEEPR